MRLFVAHPDTSLTRIHKSAISRCVMVFTQERLECVGRGVMEGNILLGGVMEIVSTRTRACVIAVMRVISVTGRQRMMNTSIAQKGENKDYGKLDF